MFGLEDWVLKLGSSVDMVDVVGAVVGIVDPLPAEGQLVVVTLLEGHFLHTG